MIQINRHNYEEYFLLSVDGELPAGAQEALEHFVRENPDLAVELEGLQQTILSAEPVLSFENKETLWRTASLGIHEENYETYFLLHQDNELNPSESHELLAFVEANPALQPGFDLLKRCRLEPEPVVFTDKQVLYRKEEKETPVVPIRWWRIAAAASVIGLGWLVWTWFPKDNMKPELAAATKIQLPAPPVAKNREVLSMPVPTHSEPGASLAKPVLRGLTTLPLVPERQIFVSAETATQPSMQPQEKGNPESTTRMPAQSFTGIQQSQLIQPTAETLVTATETTEIASPTVYRELNTDEENKSLLVGSIEINKDKLRGFFRKASSIFRNKAARQEEERAEEPITPNPRPLK